ncbi:recombinase family protein [Mycolicibacterium vaccae]|uniref:recombinase family protein n=1 Tax=Mycolicibacterium vaccae TaxID=1810 RepID=UPI003CFF4BA6
MGRRSFGPLGKAMLTIMAAFAQLERDTMIERTRACLAAAAGNGRKGGRPRKVDDAGAANARSMRDKGINATDMPMCTGCPALRCTATSTMRCRFLHSATWRTKLLPPHGQHVEH